MKDATNRRPVVGGAPWAWVLAISVLAVVVRLPGLRQPLDRDSAAYAVIGRGLWHGLLPYRDVFDHKQPLVYVPYALIDALGAGSIGVRVVAMLAAATTGALLVCLAPLIGRARAVAAGALCVAVGALPAVEGYDLNAEHLLAPVSAAAVVLAIRRPASGSTPGLCGFLLGLALLCKATALFVAPAVLLPLLACARSWRHRRSQALGVLAGGLLATMPVLLVYLVSGAFDDLLDANITYNRAYLELAQPTPGRFFTPEPRLVGVLVLSGLLAAALRLTLTAAARGTVLTILVWLLGAWAGAKLGARDFAHYFAPVVPPACLLLLLPPGARERAAWPARGVAAAQAALIVANLLPATWETAAMFRRSPLEVTAFVYGDTARRVWSQYAPVGSFLQSQKQPGDTLFVAGAEPGFYLFSGLGVVGRYIYDYPLLLSPRRQQELEQQLCQTPPDWLILPYGAEWPDYLAPVDPRAYVLVHVADPVHVYALRRQDPCSAAVADVRELQRAETSRR